MTKHIPVSEMNVRVTCKAYDFVQGTYGGTTPVLRESFDDWFKVEQLSGSTNTVQGQQQSQSQYKLTCQYNAALNENWFFFFEGLPLKVNQMQVDDPAYRRQWIIYCSVTNQLSGWS